MFADEIKIYHLDLPEKRKKDLNTGLNNNISLIMQYCCNLIESNYTSLLNSQNNQELYKINIFMLNQLISTLRSYVEWIPIRY